MTLTRTHWAIFGAGLLALPFIFSASVGEQMREPKAQFLILICGIMLSYELGRRISWPLGAGAALCYLSSFFLAHAFPYEQLLMFSAAMGSCLLFTQFKKNDVERLFELLEAAGCLTAAYALIFQFTDHDPFLHAIPGASLTRVPAFFGQHTLYGPFAVGCFAPALFRRHYWRAALIAAPIPLINSSFTYLSLGVVLAMFAIFRLGKRAILGLSLMAALAAGWVGYTYARGDYVKQEALNDNGRFALWNLTWAVSKPRLLIGHGYSSFQIQFPLFLSKEIRQANGLNDEGLSEKAKRILALGEELRLRSGIFLHPHNELLLVLYEFGLVGVFVALTIILTFFFFWVDCPDTAENWALGAIFFSFLANSMGNFPLHLIPQALLPLWAFTLVTTCRDRGILDL